MLLHTATGYHAHEYSRNQPTRTSPIRSASLPRRSSLSRSAYSAPVVTKSIIIEPRSPIPGRPLRTLSENITPVREPVVRFLDSEQDTMSEDGRSEGSSVMTGGGRRRKRPLRTYTTFLFAHPAPTLTQKQKLLNIRPKLLLQLQQISVSSRSRPLLDVLPSTVVAPRLRKKFPRMFRSKGELGCNDVMIVKSEDYESIVEDDNEGSEGDEDGYAKRDLVAVICQMPKDLGGSQGKAELVLSDGSVWTCSPTLDGPYDLKSTDEQGRTVNVRWANPPRRRRSVGNREAINGTGEVKFTFSIMDPTTRRHPILATLRPNNLEIPDSYTTCSSSAGIRPPSSSVRTEPDSADDEEPVPRVERKTIYLDEKMKTLIQVTAIWVALRQGWSQSFRYNDAMASGVTRASSVGRKSTPGFPEVGRLSPAPTVASFADSNHGSFGSVLGGKLRRASGVGTPGSGGSPQLDRVSGTPKRAVSTGTAFMQRAAALRGISTVHSDSEGESMMEAKERFSQNDGANDSKRFSTPTAPLTLPGSSTTTPDTPTQRKKRPVSYQPTTSSTLQNGFTPPPDRRRSMTADNLGSTSGPGKKIGKWKSFTNLFRKGRHSKHSD